MSKWSQSLISGMKKSVKETIDAGDLSTNPKARLQYILELLNRKQQDDAVANALEIYILCVSALVHASRYEGLSSAEINRIFNLAEGILGLQGINPQRSRIGFYIQNCMQL